ncbi:MAG TPA: multicopper oxidase domain-containing protein [Gracilimonas sp.]|uniref:multicopper oxidase domain-containing protein n=1 Tax=Gracilimonas sp. TaxID=1974203 RepID=UPI002D99D801|nr:multicopper oxidase domain-containing protein [Gracilimonas sp.]
MKLNLIVSIIAVFAFINPVQSQDLQLEVKGDSLIYHLTISEQTMNITGKPVSAMAINGSIPGPTLRFKEGKHAVIYVTNTMEEETSVHWHGLLLPNYMDGVPYLTTPPIRPDKTLRYDFPLTHSGTYWYHSHTGLQEQKGIYGSIVIEPKEKELEYDEDLVLVLSDWTNDDPHHIMKNLKRHNEWYGVELGNAPSLLKSIQSKTVGSQFKLWAQKMPGMHISDIPYDAFLINGKQEQVYDQFEPGTKIRLRVINAGASSYFWLNYAGGDLKIVSADGLNVQPVETEKVLIGLAETYDFIITVKEGESLEFQATSQDVTGSASAFVGNGTKKYASDIPFPDYQQMGAEMADMHGGSGHDMSLDGEEDGTFSTYEATTSEHDMMDMSDGEEMDHDMHNNHNMHSDQEDEMEEEEDHSMHEMDDPTAPMTMWETGYNNSILKSPESTEFSEGDSVRNLTFNLTGNMWRYTWSINGETLSASDKIKIEKGEVVRVTLNNTTMMHHPMHLHGHFFRVLNGNGEYAPLKHTVDVPPMSRITIEFAANEEKDWFFHCHILYHMKAGMSRVFSYEGSERDERLAPYPVGTLYKHDKEFFTWGTVTGMSHMGTLDLVASNTNNQFNLETEFGWNQNYELTADYERFVGNYFRIYGGIQAENIVENSLDDHEVVGRIGMRYLLLYILDTDLGVDHKLRPELKLNTHIPLTQRLMAVGHFKWKMDAGLVEDLPIGENLEQETSYTAGLEYLLNEYFSITANYDEHFGWGAGLSLKF